MCEFHTTPSSLHTYIDCIYIQQLLLLLLEFREPRQSSRKVFFSLSLSPAHAALSTFTLTANSLLYLSLIKRQKKKKGKKPWNIQFFVCCNRLAGGTHLHRQQERGRRKKYPMSTKIYPRRAKKVESKRIGRRYSRTAESALHYRTSVHNVVTDLFLKFP